MWSFDPELLRELQAIKQMVKLRRMTPTREWSLLFLEDHDVLFVIREWPDGSLTAYTMARNERHKKT